MTQEEGVTKLFMEAYMGKYSEQNIKEFFTVLNEANIITVSCPCCMEQRFSFSRNVLEKEGGILFSCSNCSSLVKICYNEDNEVFVQCLS